MDKISSYNITGGDHSNHYMSERVDLDLEGNGTATGHYPLDVIGVYTVETNDDTNRVNNANFPAWGNTFYPTGINANSITVQPNITFPLGYYYSTSNINAGNYIHVNNNNTNSTSGINMIYNNTTSSGAVEVVMPFIHRTGINSPTYLDPRALKTSGLVELRFISKADGTDPADLAVKIPSGKILGGSHSHTVGEKTTNGHNHTINLSGKTPKVITKLSGSTLNTDTNGILKLNQNSSQSSFSVVSKHYKMAFIQRIY